MTHRAIFAADNYILKELGNGSYGTVYASIPKAIANQILSDLKDPCNPLDRSEAKSKLRTALQAAKIAKGGFSPDKNDCRVEIEALQILNEDNNPNIISLKAADSSSQYGWFTLEPLAGGDLINFRKTILTCGPSNPPPISLAWHFIHDLANALLTMHTHGYAHMDIAERNIMLRPRGAFRDYPDVVIVDFGNSCDYRQWMKTSQSSTAKNSAALRSVFVGMYVRDLTCLRFPLQFSFEHVARNNSLLSAAMRGIKEYQLGKGERAEEYYVNFLIRLRDQALKEREREYKVLPEPLVEYFRQLERIVSDEDLEKAFPNLA
ncbi:uncharacterized protein RCC_02702 [Ramularia collo-cygni]|uniref:non-specific serine/threonine protein kinase n=1 Tax=Ramularia collo-cygni TaxID=112498 RepID=A0A2D3UX63_9PEZI|nr:uncharacterized protein RCC_02702 [Ramularia collo-cygni]CZT16867.1 uncharacterized protein RCC_02702 [Ramularia collo-cygni]